MTEKRFDYEYNHNIFAYILTDNGEEITSFDAEGVSDEDIKIIIDLLNEQEKEIQRLKLIINGLNYALKNIRQIDVEIDLNECGDVE